jgi:hypothetical protein
VNLIDGRLHVWLVTRSLGWTTRRSITIKGWLRLAEVAGTEATEHSDQRSRLERHWRVERHFRKTIADGIRWRSWSSAPEAAERMLISFALLMLFTLAEGWQSTWSLLPSVTDCFSQSPALSVALVSGPVCTRERRVFLAYLDFDSSRKQLLRGRRTTMFNIY